MQSHPSYTALARTPEARAAAHRHLLQEALNDEDLTAIRNYLQQQCAWERDDFQTMVEAKAHRFVGIRPTHRPPRDNQNLRKCARHRSSRRLAL